MSRRRYSRRRDYERTYNRTLARRDAHRHADRVDRYHEVKRAVWRFLFFSKQGAQSVLMAAFMTGFVFLMRHDEIGFTQMIENGEFFIWMLFGLGVYAVLRAVLYLIK